MKPSTGAGRTGLADPEQRVAGRRSQGSPVAGKADRNASTTKNRLARGAGAVHVNPGSSGVPRLVE